METTDGGEVYSPNVGGKRFLKNKFFSLGRRTPWRPPTVEKCTFLPRAEKEQDNYAEGIIIFKRVAQKCWTSPTPVMRDGDGLTLAEVSIRRKDAFWEVNCVRVHTRRCVH